MKGVIRHIRRLHSYIFYQGGVYSQQHLLTGVPCHEGSIVLDDHSRGLLAISYVRHIACVRKSFVAINNSVASVVLFLMWSSCGWSPLCSAWLLSIHPNLERSVVLISPPNILLFKPSLAEYYRPCIVSPWPVGGSGHDVHAWVCPPRG